MICYFVVRFNIIEYPPLPFLSHLPTRAIVRVLNPVPASICVYGMPFASIFAAFHRSTNSLISYSVSRSRKNRLHSSSEFNWRMALYRSSTSFILGFFILYSDKRLKNFSQSVKYFFLLSKKIIFSNLQSHKMTKFL